MRTATACATSSCSNSTQPYKAIIGADSHTCTYSALGAFATGRGSTDMAAIMAYGKAWLKVPTSYMIEVEEKLSAHVYSKDVFLYLCGRITADGATYMSMEFLGSTVDDMGVESRAVMQRTISVCRIFVSRERSCSSDHCESYDKARKKIIS